MTKFFVYTQIGQKHRREIEKIVRDEAKAIESESQYDEYTHKPKYISCNVCENVEKTSDPHAHISVPIYTDGRDAGYIHIFGWKAV